MILYYLREAIKKIKEYEIFDIVQNSDTLPPSTQAGMNRSLDILTQKV